MNFMQDTRNVIDKFKSRSEAIAKANIVQFGLASGIVSRERIQYEALITGQKVGVMRVDWE